MRENDKIQSLVFLSIAAIAYTAIVGHWAANRFLSFNATFWDLGIMIQAIWNTAHGRLLHESINLGISTSRIAVAHWEFIYLPLAALFRIIPSVPVLLYAQTAALAAGVFPIYLFARKKLNAEIPALLIAVAYLFYPAMHGANLFDLHGLTFATPMLLFTFYFMDKGSRTGTFIFALFSLSCREDVAIPILFLGLYIWFFKKQRGTGILLFVSGALWLMLFFLRGYFFSNGEILSQTGAASNWTHLGEHGIFSIFTAPFARPVYFFQTLFSPENVKYLIKLLLPLLGLCLLAPSILLICLPALLLNLLSDWSPMRHIEYQYTATITPFLFLAAIQGLANFSKWTGRYQIFIRKSRIIPLAVTAMVLAASILSTTQFSILRFHGTWLVSEEHRALTARLHEIPSFYSVSATARLGPHLAAREKLFHFPQGADSADLVLIELNRPIVEMKNPSGKFPTSKVPAFNEAVKAAFQDTTLGLLFESDNVFCLKRGFDTKTSFAEYAILEKLPEGIQTNGRIDLNNGLSFLGWSPVYVGEQQAHFKIYWKKDSTWKKGRNIELVLSSDGSEFRLKHRPVFGRFEIEDWPVGNVICDHVFVDRPSEMRSMEKCDISATVPSSKKNINHFLFDVNFYLIANSDCKHTPD